METTSSKDFLENSKYGLILELMLILVLPDIPVKYPVHNWFTTLD